MKTTIPFFSTQKKGLTALFTCVLLTVVPLAKADSLSEILGATTNTTTTLTQKPEIASVNEAFSLHPQQKGNKLTIHVEVKDGYHLYQNKLKLDLPKGVTAIPLQFDSLPKTVDDPDFGKVPVFEENFTATTTLSASQPLTTPNAIIKWQGCAKAGLCYPPQKTAFTLANFVPTAPGIKDSPTKKAPESKNVEEANANSWGQNFALTALSTPTIVSPTITPEKIQEKVANTLMTPTLNEITNKASTPQPTFHQENNQDTNQTTGLPIVSASSPVSRSVSTPSFTAMSDPQVSHTNEPTIANKLESDSQHNDPFGLVAYPILAMALLFLAGLGLAFTPCVLPMLPIIANIIARQHALTAKKGLLLTTGYGLGVATSYGVLGALIAVFGQSLGIINWLQKPSILLSFALLFTLLGFYMLDKLPIRLPVKFSQSLNKLTKIGENRLGSVTGSFITGFFSALVVSPCVSAPLAGALAGVATSGSVIIGFLALFMLGLGLSTPLILLGATQGNFMPKSGTWMSWVKTGFALLMFAVALLMVERVFIASWVLGLWAVWFAVVARWAWQWQHAGKTFTQAMSFVLMSWSAGLMFGMASGSTDSWQPLKPFITAHATTNLTHDIPRITTLSQLAPIIASHQKVLVDVSADWCLECRIMDKTLFANPPETLKNWQVVKLDVTEDSAESQQIYQSLKVFGPPVLLYFNNGKLVYRQDGEVKRSDFERATRGR